MWPSPAHSPAMADGAFSLAQTAGACCFRGEGHRLCAWCCMWMTLSSAKLETMGLGDDVTRGSFWDKSNHLSPCDWRSPAWALCKEGGCYALSCQIPTCWLPPFHLCVFSWIGIRFRVLCAIEQLFSCHLLSAPMS